MLSTLKDIAVFLDATADGERIGRHAAGIARRHNSHLVGIYGISRNIGHPSESFARGSHAIREVMDRRRQADEQKALAAARHIAALSLEYGISSEFRVVWHDDAQGDAALRALHCDLIVAAQPKPQDLPRGWTAERLLLASGIPVLLVPISWSGTLIGNTVLVAWNGSREARRAVADAMPFLTSATTVTILIVDGDRDPSPLEEPGLGLVRNLTKHGANVETGPVQSNGTPIADVILAQAVERKADLLIIGAYSHPRTTELLFGGVTRTLLADVSIPLLISR